MSIEVINVSKYYGEQKALDNVSFKVEKGEIFGFLGPNGAGKTTMMKIIMGIIPPNEGQVLVNGMDILNESIEVRKQIGYLPENNPLYMDMYVKEYLTFVASIYKINNKSSRVAEIIEQTGLGVEQHKLIGSLSKGYKQRVGIAQALIHNPSVLILDEPTSGLDPNQIIEIRNLIAQVGKQKTVLLSTHIMQEVEAICKRIIIINKGKLVADNNKESLQESMMDKEKFVIFVEFDKTVALDDLSAIKGVKKVKSLKKMQFIIDAESDVRPLIFQFAVKKNITVLSLQRKEKSLEELFHELTRE
ncbi:MAG TPA: gliding motility-associated ABC transporter ATP-binding subunit GldA [Bacteroidales bacterium]|jgi:ABC-2 type transport system ATP-binding protein|nr:gliding motility-associated ABC transporter ATP-binding subunit GldA [Bacteroidales bacterium]